MLDCHIVKDLLPNYTDGLLSEKTRQEVQQHLQGCGECRSLSDQMNLPITEAPLQTGEKEINFLKKIKMKTLWMKAVAGVLAFVLVAFGVLAWIFAIGAPVSSQDIVIKTEIQNPDYETYLGREWVIHFTLANRKALVARGEYVFSDNPDGSRSVTGRIIKLYQTPATNWVNEADSFTWGYAVHGKEAPTSDFTVTVRLKDRDIVYSMTEEGLFEPQ